MRRSLQTGDPSSPAELLSPIAHWAPGGQTSGGRLGSPLSDGSDRIMFTQAVLAAALNDIDTTNPQSIQDAKRHADAFRKVSPIKFPYPDLVKDDGGLLRVATTERSHPPGAPQLDTDLLRQLSMRIQDVFLNHAFDHTPQLRQEIVVVLGRVCTGLSEIAQHAQFYQHQLMTTHGLVGGVTALLRCDSPEASAHAALLLSQMALASPESAERLVMQKFFLDAVASMIGGRHEVAVDSAVTPKPETRNPKPENRNPKHETRNSKPGTRNTDSGTRKPNPETRNPMPETLKPRPETRNPKHKTRNTKPETRNPKPSILDPRPQTLDPRP
ncbi:hypothetical protein T484DRAFT_2838493 [Baffinella frigidus]|nr:hypothetical protein T484DRAFT_2838493 [Cryptophyta sp. CCMP2293]